LNHNFLSFQHILVGFSAEKISVQPLFVENIVGTQKGAATDLVYQEDRSKMSIYFFVQKLYLPPFLIAQDCDSKTAKFNQILARQPNVFQPLSPDVFFEGFEEVCKFYELVLSKK